MSDTIHLAILEDGTLTVKTSDISDGNHLAADALMEQLDTLMGGHVNIKENGEELNKMKNRISKVHAAWVTGRR